MRPGWLTQRRTCGERTGSQPLMSKEQLVGIRVMQFLALARALKLVSLAQRFLA
jgi:hypothetical protein